jgi:hypothetical protein
MSAPFFIYEGIRFWGNDRIDWLVLELTEKSGRAPNARAFYRGGPLGFNEPCHSMMH